MRNSLYIQITVSDEQKLYARKLVEHSLRHHHVSNIWDGENDLLIKTRMMRYTGSLGEIVFADAYHLARPEKSFGADDGQDWGQDFIIISESENFSLDIKSMKRKSGNLSAQYVLNIPSSQLHKPNSKTTHYFCISFHQSEKSETVASLLGFIDKSAIENGEIGTFYPKGSTRTRIDQTTFTFFSDTYEIPLADIEPPVVTDFIKRAAGFKVCQLRK